MLTTNSDAQTKKMFLIAAHYSLHNCSIFRTIGLAVDSSDQIMLTTVALKVLLRSMWTLPYQTCAMFPSSLQRTLMNIVAEPVEIHHFAVAKEKITNREDATKLSENEQWKKNI